MNSSLFRKQLALTAAVTLVFMILGFMAAFLAMEWERQSAKDKFASSPPVMFAKLVDRIAARLSVSKVEALAVIEGAEPGAGDGSGAGPGDGPPGAAATPWPEEGRPPRPPGGGFKILTRDQAAGLVDDETLPQSAYDSRMIQEPGREREGMRGRPPFHFGPGKPPGRVLVRLAGPEEAYLLAAPFGGPPGGRPRGLGPFWINFIVLNVSVLLASALSLFILFSSMRSKAKLAASVISEMKAGNLSARFPIKKSDEIGGLMVEFNKMADEIERLVERIRSAELSRMRLLQELAHDLRTPVASLKTLLETMINGRDSIDNAIRDEFMGLSLKEVEYFERLVEDLLFLAQVTDPKYVSEKAQVNVGDLLSEELDAISARYGSHGSPVRLSRQMPEGEIVLSGDAHLLRRLFRNAFDNAFSFASSSVRVSARVLDRSLVITVEDDGPGLSEKSIAAFGEKRGTRVIGAETKGRLSVGLGSVIMKAITNLHDGRLSITNIVTAQGGVGGARLTIEIAME